MGLPYREAHAALRAAESKHTALRRSLPLVEHLTQKIRFFNDPESAERERAVLAEWLPDVPELRDDCEQWAKLRDRVDEELQALDVEIRELAGHRDALRGEARAAFFERLGDEIHQAINDRVGARAARA
ncbi:hypothetical protein GCM10010167_44720 [Paractinoplanes deccanensis]